jgi:hypothetical protein
VAAQLPLIDAADLLRFGGSSDFLDQFRPRPLTILVVTGGAVGAMSFQWKRIDEEHYSATITSEAGASWAVTLPDLAYATLTFADGAYAPDTAYSVGSTGMVLPGAGAFNGLTATRLDLIADACISATKKAATWMQPRVVPPVHSVGEDIKQWIADVAKYGLRSRNGLTPPGAGAGDDNDRLRAVDAEKNLKLIGQSTDRPFDLVDSSGTTEGAGFPALPTGGALRGW